MRRQFVCECKGRLAQFVVRHADLRQGQRMAQAGARRLGQRFLGGEALHQQARRVGEGAVFGHFLRAQNAPRRTLAMAIMHGLDARVSDNVGADAENHATSSAFIFFTACSSPMKSASATIAWPMLSSAMCGMATMGRTLW